ncbi:diguanylate cyclase domain-containing protein [Sulfurimonas sp.]
MKSDLKNFSLLYIEDNKETQESMKLLLEDDVKTFYQAYDGKEALEIFQVKKPDIILSDITLPLLDGLHVAKKIKEHSKDTPIILLSAFDDTEKLLASIEIGINYFLAKPIDMTMLFEKLQTIAKNIAQKREEKMQHEKLVNLAHYDTLTQIPNRFLFQKKLEELQSRATRHTTDFALFFIDIDDFKSVNDNYGHNAGDIVLCTLAQNIKKILRLEDVFARISGDEFAILVENIQEDQALKKLAKKVIAAVATPILYEQKELYVSCSIGISRFPVNSTQTAELLQQADTAMYAAKKNGKNNFAFY